MAFRSGNFLSLDQPSHDEGDGIKFIVPSSILHNGQQLTEVNWMFIPAGELRSLKVGPFGILMCHYCVSF
jgi:hypothetical protein